ncbi:MAG: gephyrin-like molybdotransferase Glp [Acidobacteriota bacterium]
MIEVERALHIILREVKVLGMTEVNFREAVGMVLARNVVAETDMPPFDKSMMDGYAVRSKDLSRIPALLTQVDFIPAGRKPSRRIGKGECARIMTGAPLPEGSDSVQMLEYAESVESGKRIKILRTVRVGENIMRKGEEASRGEIILERKTLVSPVETAILAGWGKVDIPVFKKPAVSVLATGDEVVEPENSTDDSKIRNSTSYFIVPKLQSMGINPDYLGISRDDPVILQKKLKRGLESDCLLISGGASAGDYDIVSENLEELGVHLFFSKVAIKPGKPLLFGRKNRTLIFGLPGNPLSCFTDFTVFVLPALKKMTGRNDYWNRILKGKLQETMNKKKDRTHYRIGWAEMVKGEIKVSAVHSAGSSDILSATRGNCFIILPRAKEVIRAGGIVDILIWD